MKLTRWPIITSFKCNDLVYSYETISPPKWPPTSHFMTFYILADSRANVKIPEGSLL